MIGNKTDTTKDHPEKECFPSLDKSQRSFDLSGTTETVGRNKEEKVNKNMAGTPQWRL